MVSSCDCYPSVHSRKTCVLIYSPTDKTIKLWKVFDKQIKVVAENNHSEGYQTGVTGPSQPPLRLPRMTVHDSITAAVPRKVYANAHAYHINSISVNSDQETYISADDLRVNLWNLNISDQSFSELGLLIHLQGDTADSSQTLSTLNLSIWRN